MLAASSVWRSTILKAGCVLPGHALAQIVTQSHQQCGLCEGAIYRELLKSFTTMKDVAWHEIVWCGDNVPAARKHHTLTAFGDKSGRACLFGGECVPGSRRRHFLNDVWILHLSPVKAQAKWQRVVTDGPAPCSRCRHDAVISRNRVLIVHGGLLEEGCALCVCACVCVHACVCACACVVFSYLLMSNHGMFSFY